MKAYNNQTFIHKANVIHGGLYNYDEVIYNGSKKKVKIKCLLHGYFEQTPSEHLRGEGCAICGQIKKRKLIYGVGVNDILNVNKLLSYRVWKGLLQRCYDSKYQEKEPTYKGCKVCDEWLLFSTFKKWFDDNYIKGYFLDKDILSALNKKTYSPETCCFVPREINNLIICSNRNGVGVSFHKRINKWQAQSCDMNGKKISLGYYDNAEDAHNAYCAFKKDVVKDIANKFYGEGKISERVFKGLLNYKF